MKKKCYCVICKKIIGEYYPSQTCQTCSKKCTSILISKNNTGVNNPNYRHGKCIENKCKKCSKLIRPVSTYCNKCRAIYNNSFKGKKHTKQTKKQIGKKSKGKFTKKYINKMRKKFKGNRSLSTQGYVLIKNYTHPNRNHHNKIPEHMKVMSDHLKRPLKKGEIVHHINENITDNRIENLHLCKSIKEHMKIHQKLKNGKEVKK